MTGETDEIVVEYFPLNRLMWDFEQNMQRANLAASLSAREIADNEKRIKELRTNVHQMTTAARADQIEEARGIQKNIAGLSETLVKLKIERDKHQLVADTCKVNIEALKAKRQVWRLPADLSGLSLEIKGLETVL